MIGLVAVIVVGVLGYILINHIKTLKREQQKKVGAKVGILTFIGTLLFLAVTGKLYLLAALGTGLVMFAKRLFPFLRYLPMFRGLYKKAKAAQGSGSNQQSTVETSLLRMTLNHESGELDGELLDTVSKGRYLSEFGMSDLVALYVLAQSQYPDSTEVLAAYLDRNYGDDWREAANTKGDTTDGQESNATKGGKMTKSEAYEVLGLDHNASQKEIIDTHRKLMLKLHPDRGGSNYLAAKINQAKDTLIND
jgi:hypothetical protein